MIRHYPRHFLMLQMRKRGEPIPLRWMASITARTLASSGAGTSLTYTHRMSKSEAAEIHRALKEEAEFLAKQPYNDDF